MGTTRRREGRRVASKTARRPAAASHRRAREASEQFRLAQETLGIVTWVWDLPNDRVQWYGDIARMLGQPAGAFAGRFSDYLKQVHPDDAGQARDTFLQCLKGGRPDYRAVERVIWPDGSIHWLETYGKAQRDTRGKPVRMTGVIKEITERKRQEDMAREAERKFGALFEHSPIGLIVTRPLDRIIVEVNDAALRIVGLQRGEAIGRRTIDVVKMLQPEEERILRERALAGEPVLGAELEVERLDGKRIALMVSAARIDLAGEPHFVLSILDLTESRRAERERQEADERYRTLFDVAIDGFFVTTADHFILDANPAACRITGYGRDELIGMNVASLYSATELAARPLRQDLAQRWGMLEREMTRRNGSTIPVEVRAGPMPDGRALGIVRDISERKRTEALVMNIARGVSADTGDSFFRSLVEHLARELGADMAFIGEIVSPEQDRVRALACVADGQIASNFEYRLEGSPCLNAVSRRGTVIYPQGVAELFPQDHGLRKRGIEAYVGTSLHAVDGTPLGVLVVMQRRPLERGRFWASMIEIFGARAAAEIERARAEALVRETNASLERLVRSRTAELEDANRELESYNYSISHDLRQPLGAIGGFAELLREHAGSLQGVAAESLREIEGNAERMERMIQALLELSRAGRGTVRDEPVDAGELVQSVLADLAAEAPLAGVVRVAELPPARGDATLLRQVWANLIGNAVKYSRTSPAPRVEVTGRVRDGGVEYRVTDNGVGFDPRQAGRLFEAFERLPSAAGFEGSGVGLAVAARIVRRHGGRIEADSAPGEGSTFRFTLPA